MLDCYNFILLRSDDADVETLDSAANFVHTVYEELFMVDLTLPISPQPPALSIVKPDKGSPSRTQVPKLTKTGSSDVVPSSPRKLGSPLCDTKDTAQEGRNIFLGSFINTVQIQL